MGGIADDDEHAEYESVFALLLVDDDLRLLSKHIGVSSFGICSVTWSSKCGGLMDLISVGISFWHCKCGGLMDSIFVGVTF